MENVTRKKATTTYQPRQMRHFSLDFRKKIVHEIETKRIAVKDVVSLYDLSRSAIYQWLYKYAKHYEKGTKMVLELESEAERTKYLQAKVAELERALGQKQMEVDFLNKAVEFCSKEIGYDVKKKYSTIRSNGLE